MSGRQKREISLDEVNLCSYGIKLKISHPNASYWQQYFDLPCVVYLPPLHLCIKASKNVLSKTGGNGPTHTIEYLNDGAMEPRILGWDGKDLTKYWSYLECEHQLRYMASLPTGSDSYLEETFASIASAFTHYRANENGYTLKDVMILSKRYGGDVLIGSMLPAILESLIRVWYKPRRCSRKSCFAVTSFTCTRCHLSYCGEPYGCLIYHECISHLEGKID